MMGNIPSLRMRRISWVKAALKDFKTFPVDVQERIAVALRIAAAGEKADSAKPMKGLGRGVFEIAVPWKSDAYRAVYGVQIGEEVWVVHAFKKKSKQGIKTPRREIEVIEQRIKQLREWVT